MFWVYRILYFLLVASVRLVLYLIGWVTVALSLVSDGANNTPKCWRMWAQVDHNTEIEKWSRWEKYKWFAFRNPTPGLIDKWQQPIPEPRPNPDQIVRNENRKSTSRWLVHGVYWEYWYLRQIDWKLGKKHYKWFEFRVGWKFVDGNAEFFPTIQLGPRSS